MKTILASLVTIAILSASTASAELKSTVPADVCAYMSVMGLKTRGWKNQYDNIYGCSSSYKDIGTGYPLANNLAYYAEGERTVVTQVKLVLNVNNKGASNAAHSELLKAAEALTTKASGKTLPQSLKDAIKSGSKRSAKVGNSSIEVVRINWPTGKGYEIKVFIE